MNYYYEELSSGLTFTNEIYFVDDEAYFLDSLDDEALAQIGIKRVSVEQNLEQNSPQISYTTPKEQTKQNLDYDISSMQKTYIFMLEQEAKLYLLSQNEDLSPSFKACAKALNKEDLKAFASEILKEAKSLRAYLAYYFKGLVGLKSELESLDDEEAFKRYESLSALSVENEEVKSFAKELKEGDFNADEIKQKLLSLLTSLKAELKTECEKAKESLKSEIKLDFLEELESLKEDFKSEIKEDLKAELQDYKPPSTENEGSLSPDENLANEDTQNSQDESGQNSTSANTAYVKKIKITANRKDIATSYTAFGFRHLFPLLEDGKEAYVYSRTDLRYKDLDDVAISITKQDILNYPTSMWLLANVLTYPEEDSASSFLSAVTNPNQNYDFEFSFERPVKLKGVMVSPFTWMSNRDFCPYIKISLYGENELLLASAEYEFSKATQANKIRLGLGVNGEDLSYASGL
ncbi:hypothetical protein [Campylobacter avium]|uniref:hypothetical protein n=1 Tax=Campylobacter avium TaxID=522485 RepID=UPI00248D3A73|nr:hypothetical protein [Campylobacter avium]